eukprot:3469682-Rhodomonas_salina.3
MPQNADLDGVRGPNAGAGAGLRGSDHRSPTHARHDDDDDQHQQQDTSRDVNAHKGVSESDLRRSQPSAPSRLHDDDVDDPRQPH